MSLSKEVIETPNVLNIRLNRDFHYAFAPEMIGTPTTPNPVINFGNSQYTLKSVISHYGQSLNSGHYKSFLFNNNKWTEYNDSISTGIKEAPLTGYLLFYEKIPSSSHEKISMRDETKPNQTFSKTKDLKRKQGIENAENNTVRDDTP